MFCFLPGCHSDRMCMRGMPASCRRDAGKAELRVVFGRNEEEKTGVMKLSVFPLCCLNFPFCFGVHIMSCFLQLRVKGALSSFRHIKRRK